MKKTLLATALVVAASAGSAFAGGSPGSIGVGAEYLLAGGLLGAAGGGSIAGGPSINYDTGAFHVGGFLSITDGGGDNDTNIGIGGRFFYHVASSAMADFSVGGSIGYLSIDGPGDRAGLIFIEPGAQIRAFVATNVALSATIGLTIGAGDAQGLALTGQTVTGGIHYYFF